MIVFMIFVLVFLFVVLGKEFLEIWVDFELYDCNVGICVKVSFKNKIYCSLCLVYVDFLMGWGLINDLFNLCFLDISEFVMMLKVIFLI